MSVLNRLFTLEINGRHLSKSRYQLINISASYSRRSDSKNIESPYKVVKSKVRLEDEGGSLGDEGGPNWELLAPRGNRFYFPGSIGPAWQNSTTTIQVEGALQSLIDFEGKIRDKLQMKVQPCPALLRKSIHEIFPAPEVLSNEMLTVITLQYTANSDYEQGASKFVLAAKEICSKLRLNGYWSDFMNPFSGRPFYSYVNSRNLFKIDDRFRGLGMKLEELNNCIIISRDEENTFSGSVFTNAPSNFVTLKSLIDD